MRLSGAHPTPLFSGPQPATLGRMGTGRVLVPEDSRARRAAPTASRAFGDALDGNHLAAHDAERVARKAQRKEQRREEASHAEASRRVAMKGLRRRVTELEAALAEREASARLEASFFEEERAHFQADLEHAIEHERRLAAEEAFTSARAAEAAEAATRDARVSALEEELAGERRRAEELVAVVSRQSKDLAKGGADIAELRESFERAAEVRTAEARREMEREMERLRETKAREMEWEMERLRQTERDAERLRETKERDAERLRETERDAERNRLVRALDETREKLEREMNRRVETERRLEEAERREDVAAAPNAAATARRRETARAASAAAAAIRRDHERLRAEMRQLVMTSSSDVAEATRRAEALGAAAAAAAERFDAERRERRRLANALLELKGNVRAFVRVRPLSAAERDRGECAALVPSSSSEVRLNTGGGLRPSADARRFEMDAVFGPEASQSTVFEEVAPLVRSALDGYHACIFAYGQTGSGKTHTMEGSEEDRGITFRALSALFREAERERATTRYEFAVEMLEVYNDKVRDLLELDPAKPKPHDVRQGPDGAFVTDLERVPVSSSMDVMRVMRRGTAARKTGRTDMNERSSRSHLVFTVHVVGVNATRGETTRSRLNLVDLAGSERLSKTNATGERLAEAQHINKSLSALGNCMSALATRQRHRKKHGAGAAGHVPFRDCKLTHILSPCLGGDSKTLMFVHAGPAASEAGESACTLEFASRVRAVELGPARRNVVANDADGDGDALARAREEIAAKNRRIEHLKRELEAARG